MRKLLWNIWTLDWFLIWSKSLVWEKCNVEILQPRVVYEPLFSCFCLKHMRHKHRSTCHLTLWFHACRHLEKSVCVCMYVCVCILRRVRQKESREFRWGRSRPEVEIAESGCWGWGRSEIDHLMEQSVINGSPQIRRRWLYLGMC